ncbi:MAG: hypothetical protein JO068_13795 [Hyphomicrobiales bacterium]|nr:hypothetical protein [Hyphomicrobiales bacterium]
MSTKPKLDDQTQAALSAIEEALKGTAPSAEPRLPEATSDIISVRRPAPEARGHPAPNPLPRPAPPEAPLSYAAPSPSPASEQSIENGRNADVRPRAGELAPTAAANDDREVIGNLLRTMQAKPSSRPMLLAMIASILWAIAVGALVWWRLGLGSIADQAALIERLETPTFGFALALLIGPIIFFLVLAGLFRRSSELGLTARSLSQIAFRLADPQVSAQDAVVSVSTAIRREVVAMNDGIERAMARATELESLVHREISTLERAYGENELRIRSLIDELITQREGIATHSERVRDVIADTHLKLSTELSAATAKLTGSLDDTGTRVVETLHGRSELVTSALGQAGERIMAEIGARGTELTERLLAATDSVGRQLAVSGDAITAEMERRSKDVTDRLASITGGISQEIVTRGESVTRGLEDTGTRVTQQLAEVGVALSGSLDRQGSDLTTRLETTGTRVAEQVAQIGTDVAGSLERVSGNVVTRLDETGTSLVAHLDRVGGDMHQSLNNTGNLLANALNEGANAVNDRLADTGRGIIEGLVGRSVEVREDLRSIGESIVTELGTRVSEVTGRLDETGQRISQTIVSGGDALSERLAATGDRIEETVTGRGGALEERLAALGDKLAATMDEKTSKAETTLAGHSDKLSQTLTGHLNAFEDAIVVRGGSLAEKIAADAAVFTDIVSTKLGSIENLLTTHGDGLVGRLTNHTREATQAMEEQISTFEQRANARTGEIVSSLDGLIGRIDGTLEKHAGVFTEGLKARTIEVARAIAESGRNASAQLEATLTDAGKVIGEKTVFLSERADDLNKLLGTRSSELANAFDTGVARFQNEVVGRLENLSTSLRTHTDDIHARLGDRATEIAGLFNEQTERLSTTVDQKVGALGGHVANLSQSLDRQVNGLTQNIEGQLQLLDGRISGLTSGFDRQVHELSDRVDSRLELLGTRAADLTQAMDRQIDRLETTVDGKLEDISGVLSTRTSEVNAVLGTRVEELGSAFENQISQFDARVGDRINGLSAALNERGEQFVRLLDGTGSALTENLTQRLISIKVDIERASATAADTLDRGATTLVDSFEGGVRDFSESVARSAAELRGTVDESTRHSIDALANAHETVRGEIGGILDRLSAANGLLQQIMSGAGQSLGALEAGLAKRLKDLEYLLGGIVSETNRAASRVADQVGALNSVSSSTLRNAETLLEKLESQAHALADATEAQTRGWNEAADLLERVESRIARSLASKRDALENLTVSIGDRSEELEKVTSAFRELIEDSLGAAEEKARRIGDTLSENARASVAAINEQFTHIRSSAGAERERTATALREAYESVMSDMNETFGQATSRFRDAAGEMRQITAQIQREMESTRAELHRGLVELPRETQASAGEMRRVVGEQIKVLNELTAIATRSASSLDAVEPPATNIPQPREARPAQAIGGGAAPRATANGRSGGTEPQRRPTTATAPVARERRAEAAEPRQDGLPRSGWLSDLLSRASREEPLPTATNRQPAGPTSETPSPTPAQPSLASLDTIAIDIARMIDHDAAAKMWDRYQAGEQGVFNRSMYTAQGQQMYDEIKRKYRRDDAFRDAAHRYIEEFERLLAEVARDPASQRGYLTSDTGKVYTILAHAAGRLE